MSKKILVVVVLLLVVVIAVAYFYGNSLLKGGVERSATGSVGREVRVEGVSLGLLRGQLDFDKLRIQNADGYEFPLVLEFNRIEVDAVIRSLFTDTVRVDSVLVRGVDVYVEQQGLNNNLKDVLDGMPAREDPEEPEQTEGKNVHISEILIEDIVVHLKVIGGDADERSSQIQIDPIVLSDIGTDEPINTGAVVARVTAAIAFGVIRQLGEELPREVVRQVEEAAGQTIDLGRAVIGEGREILEERGGQILEGVRDLFD